MGIYIYLQILPEAIDPGAWAEVYDETLALLTGCPDGIFDTRKVTIGKIPTLAYSRSIEYDADQPDKRRWRACGDARSKTTGETFEFFRDFRNYSGFKTSSSRKAADNDGDSTGDILARRPGSKDWDLQSIAARRVFSDKTQGAGYHVPMLAVAMLVEAAFPKAALVHGNFDAEKATQAADLVRRVLGKDIPLPIVVDGPRYLARLGETRTTDQVMDDFRYTFQGRTDDASGEFLLDTFGQEAFTRWFGRSLKETHRGETAATLGTIWRLSEWFNLGLPAGLLIDTICLDKGGPRFDPVETARAISSSWVTKPDPRSGSASTILSDGGAGWDSVDEQFASTLMDLSGMSGRRTRAYIPLEVFIEEFSTRFPDRMEEIRQALDPRPEEMNKPPIDFDSIFKRLAKEDAPEERRRPIADLVHVGSLDELSSAELEDLRALGTALQQVAPRVFEQMPKHTSWNELHIAAANLSEDQGVILTEDAWHDILRNQDRSEIEFMVVLLAIQEYTKVFWDFRSAVLENSVLRREVARIVAERPAERK